MNDADKSLTVDPNHLMRIIEKRVEVPHQLREHKDMLYDYIREFCDDQTGKIHYAVMARDLQQFNFDKETNFGIVPRSAQSISSGKHSIQAVDPKRTVFNSNFDVYDTKRIPQNQLEQIEKRVVKMNRLFRDKFKTEANLQASLQKVPADANQNLNVDDFKAFVVEQCREELIERKVSKQDVESFMSAFTFNNHGATCVEKVAPLVFETDVNKVATNLTTRVRANPPPALANEDLGTTVRGADKIDNEVNKRMRGLLEQIENKVFDSKPRFYHVFKQMDMDNDGYISYKDFEQHLEKNKIFASKDEIVTLMHNVLDTEQKGYIDFTTF
jgi:Ca2+-binding EF-hand superfamily protein